MELVVDANIVFAALIKRSFIFELVRLLFKKGFKLYSPQYILEELDKHEYRLLRLSKLSKPELEFVIDLLFRMIKVVPASEYGVSLSEASKLLPEHPEDIPYFALALKLKCGVWSDEKAFRRQSRVKVFSTQDLIKLLSSVSP